MNSILDLIVTSIQQVALSLLHNWPYLLMGIVISAVLKQYVDTEKINTFLKRYRSMGVLAATGVAVGTPLCSCGTTAVVLGMMASTMPWAPIVAFMVASPLSSPEGLFFSAGVFSWPFAWAYFLASIVLGLVGGGVAAVCENRGWLANQTRYTPTQPIPSVCGCGEQPAREQSLQSSAAGCGCGELPAREQSLQSSAAGCGCGELPAPKQSLQPNTIGCGMQHAPVQSTAPACGCVPVAAGWVPDNSLPLFDNLQPAAACACAAATATLADLQPASIAKVSRQTTILLSRQNNLLREIYNSARKLLPMFLGFAFIGYFLNGLIPSTWITAIFGGGNIYSVPLAATLGLPLYINAEGSLPLVRAMLDNGMSQGAAMAFLIAGSGTSLGAIAGALTIARRRVVGLVIAVLWAGAILVGYTYDVLLALKLF